MALLMLPYAQTYNGGLIMARIPRWLTFETRQMREKREAMYRRRLYPFGQEQQDWEIAIIKELWPDFKDIRTLQYEVLILKEALYESKYPDIDEVEVPSREMAIATWEKAHRIDRAITKADEKIIKALAILETDSQSFDELPTAAAVREYMDSLS